MVVTKRCLTAIRLQLFWGMEIGEAIMASYSKNHSLLTWGRFLLERIRFIRGFVSLTIVLSNAS